MRKNPENLQQKTDEIEEKQKDLEQNCMRWEMERAAFMLRLQNIPEDTQENLWQTIGEILVPLVELDLETCQNEIDLVYRVNSSFTKKQNILREVHVRFTKRHIRDKILRKIRDENIIFKGKAVRIAKEVPWSVRKKRKEYEEMTAILQENEINYRWMSPEGLMFSFDGRQ